MEVKPIQNYETKDWLMNRHYARRMPSISFAFGLYDEGQLVGVVTYGSPPSPTLCDGVCGKSYRNNVIELNRLILDSPKKNSASLLVSRSLQMLPKPTIVVSYADTNQGHVGYIYQATNFLYTGLSAKRIEWAIKGKEHLHSKSLSDGRTVDELKEQYGDDFYYRERSRKHRYVFFVGSKSQKKKMRNALTYDLQPYPKGETQRYDASGYVATQGILF
jgi:hypothetical protein